MAGAIVSSAASWIGTQLVDEVKFLVDVEDQLRSLQQELKYVALHLKEADSGGDGGDEQLRLFTAELREIAFRAEDVVDNYILKVASSSSTTNVGGNFHRKFFCFLCNSIEIHRIGKETEAIRKNIREAVERLKQFRNTPWITPGDGTNQPRAHRNVVQTYPHTEDAYVVGLDKDVNDLVQQLTDCTEKVVAIVGPGGVGKTTLARKIFNDIRVKNRFKTRAWVTISQIWDQKGLLFEILRQTKGISHQDMNSIKDWSERQLVDTIYGFLRENSSLLVLDDMWEKEAWNCIYPALSHGVLGSKVIITTRKEDLPAHVGQNCIIHRLQLLTEKQSWELFKKIALEKRDLQVTADDNAVRLGREMTQKCGGLPLGVVTLAGLLRTKDTYEWEGVSKIFNSILLSVQGPPQYGRSIYQTLTLSYYDLPNYLKPCFLYLALFPEDTNISAKRLTRMWVAEGFVTMDDILVQGNESTEDVATHCLNELIQRYMVQVVDNSITTGKAKRCRLHDLTRDFCIAKAEEQCFLQVFSSTKRSNITTSISTHLRRASILGSEAPLPTQCSHIRSLIQFGKELNLRTICENFKWLRVLILHEVGTHDGYLPKELGNLKQLRHLALVKTRIKTLPESIENLSNLLYLEFTAAGTTETLPNVFWKMKLVRHLYLDYSFTFPEQLKLHTLTNLQTLWVIDGRRLEPTEMERLSPSIKKLGIRSVRRQDTLDAFFRSPCMTSGNLENLWLRWKRGVELKKNMELLCKHCQRLRKLKLKGRIGEDRPLLQFPPNLVKLELERTELELHDPMVAAGRLGHLKFLELKLNSYKGAKMTINAGSFAQLEELRIRCLHNLMEWRVEKGAMPRLKKLHIFFCRSLERLPVGLKFIHNLQELEIQFMPRTFCHNLFRQGDQHTHTYEYRAGATTNREERGQDFHIIQHISHVRFELVV